MATKHDNPAKFLAQILEATRQGGAAEIGLKTVERFRELDPARDWGGADLNWDDPVIRDAWAASLWKIFPGEMDRPVVVAFEKSGLSPKNPIHWRLLFSFFCWAHFRPARRRGAPQLWTAQNYCRLLQEFDRVKVRNPNLSNEAIYSIISKSGKFKKTNGEPVGPGRIKTALREARDPDCNAILAQRLLTLCANFQRQVIEGSPETEAEFVKRQIKAHCEDIATAWRRAENPVEY